MAESLDHRRLVRGLVGHLLRSHVRVLAADTPGWPRTPALSGRRPDVLGFYRAGGAVVAGEAKRGPELWACRAQLDELTHALPRYGPKGADAALVLAVLPGYEDEALALAATLTGRTAVSVWTPIHTTAA